MPASACAVCTGDILTLYAFRPAIHPARFAQFHPATVIRDWDNGQGFTIADAVTGVAAFGATGSGRLSGPAGSRHRLSRKRG